MNHAGREALRQNTYVRNPAAIAAAEARMRAVVADEREHPPSAADCAWQDDLPELPTDEHAMAVRAGVLRGPR